MSNLIKHAKRELKAVGYDLNDKEDGPNKWIVENLLELLWVFSKQGHSGGSAPYCINIFKKLAMFEPSVPLTGKDNEWIQAGTGICQKIRCSRVFKDSPAGSAYDINGKVFIEPDGASYTNGNSHVPVKFPYTPKTEYVNVDENGKVI